MFPEPVPGETIYIRAFEGHCIAIALRRAFTSSILPQDHPMFRWLDYLYVEEQRYETSQRADASSGVHTGISGISEDERAFLEGLIASECAYLTELSEARTKWREIFQDEACERAGLLPCGCHPGQHLNELRVWLEREILSTKDFSETRRLLGNMAPQDLLEKVISVGKSALALDDLEQMVRVKLLQWREARQLADERALADFDENSETMSAQAQKFGLTLEHARTRYVEALERTKKTAEEEYRQQLERAFKNRYTILKDRVEVLGASVPVVSGE